MLILNGLEIMVLLLICFICSIGLIYGLIRSKRSDERAEALEKKFTILFHHNPVWMVVSTVEEGRFLDVNEAFTRITGYSREDVIGKTSVSFGLWIDPEERKKVIDLLKREGKLDLYPIKFKMKDGSIRTCLWSSSLIELEGVLCSLNTHIDITDMEKTRKERDKLGKQLLHVQKMEAIGTLAGGIAHDFNNILSPMIGYSEILLEDLPKASSQWIMVEKLHQAAIRAKELVHQILTFSRQKDQEVKPISLQPILKEALKLLRASFPSSITIETRVDPACGKVLADPTRIHQVVMNLTTNAFHAMEESGGVLTLSLEERTVESCKLGSVELQSGRYGLMKIIDTGTGIRKEVMQNIFDPYFTTKEQGKGTGLGLSIVQGIVQTCGGAIYLFSEPGHGTEVHVYLPVIEDDTVEDEPDFMEPIPGGTERILLVDDEVSIVAMMRILLERMGYGVTGCLGSEEALKIFTKDPETFDLVITDLTMPGYNGLQLADALKSIRPNIPILICTGFGDQLNEAALKRSSVGGYLTKPIGKRELGLAIRNLLD